MNERGLRQMILHRSVRLSDGQSRSSTQCDFFFFFRAGLPECDLDFMADICRAGEDH